MPPGESPGLGAEKTCQVWQVGDVTLEIRASGPLRPQHFEVFNAYLNGWRASIELLNRGEHGEAASTKSNDRPPTSRRPV